MDAICERCGARVTGSVCGLCGGTRLSAAPALPAPAPFVPATNAAAPISSADASPTSTSRSTGDGGLNGRSVSAPAATRSARRGVVIGAAAGGAVLLAVAGWQLQARSTGSGVRGSEPPASAPSALSGTTADGSQPATKGCQVSEARVTASSTAPDGIDSAERTVSYAAQNLVDGDKSTAWRSPGSGIGETIELQFDQPCRVTAIRLLNGYHKVDPGDKADRWKQNRRVSMLEVRAGESAVTANLDARSRGWQTVQVDASNISQVSLRILGSAPSDTERDYTAMSEIQTV